MTASQSKLCAAETWGAAHSLLVGMSESLSPNLREPHQNTSLLFDASMKYIYFSFLETKSTTEAPSIRSHLSSLDVIESDDVMLICRSSGKPRPKAEWFKDGQPLQLSRRVGIESIGEVHLLVIKAARIDDSADYTCLVRNDLGQSESKAHLSVNSKLSRPVMVEKMKEVVATVGEEARFDVHFKDFALPDQVSWFRDNVKISTRGRYSVSKSNGTCTLVISNVRTDDIGTYKCVASNKAGKTTFLGYLEVIQEQQQSAPYFIDGGGTEPVVASEGYRVEVVAVVKGNPKPTIRWYKNDQVLPDSDQFEMQSVGDVHFLVIRKGSIDDSGIYKCEASNRFGIATKLYDVRIEGIRIN